MSRPVSSYILLALVVLSVVIIRVRLLDLPLERDEGEFALMGQMILDGIPPYQDAYNLKPPGIYLAYAAVMAVFGETPDGIHLGLLLVNLGCAILVFLIALKITDPQTAAWSASAFLALTLMPKVLGLNAHATHFVLLAALGGILLLSKDFSDSTSSHPGHSTRASMFIAGLLMGVSVLMKQPGIYFTLFGAMLIARGGMLTETDSPGKKVLFDLTVYSMGFIVPIALSFAWLSAAGVFDRFWFWVVTYAVAYGSELGLLNGLGLGVASGWSILFPSLVIGAVACAGYAKLRKAPRTQKFFLLAFLMTDALGVAMGLHFRRHYFVLILPAVSIFFGLGLGWIESRISKNDRIRSTAPVITTLIAFVAVAQTFAMGSGVYFAPTPARASRIMFGPNPFIESRWIAERVRELCGPGERFAIIGSEPQIYFYAARPPATGYIYMYGLVDRTPIAEKMRKEMIGEIESRRPAVIVYVNGQFSWLLEDSSDRSIFSWLGGYVRREGFIRVGVVEIVSPEKTVALVGEEARNYRAVDGEYVEIWKRRD